MLERLMFYVHPIQHAKGLVLVLFTPTDKETYEKAVPQIVQLTTEKALETLLDEFFVNLEQKIGILAAGAYELMVKRFKRHDALCTHHGVEPQDVIITLECFVTKIKNKRKIAVRHRRIGSTERFPGVEMDELSYQQAIDELHRHTMAALEEHGEIVIGGCEIQNVERNVL